jgi:hypothetical protein
MILPNQQYFFAASHLEGFSAWTLILGGIADTS